MTIGAHVLPSYTQTMLGPEWKFGLRESHVQNNEHKLEDGIHISQQICVAHVLLHINRVMWDIAI